MNAVQVAEDAAVKVKVEQSRRPENEQVTLVLIYSFFKKNICHSLT